MSPSLLRTIVLPVPVLLQALGWVPATAFQALQYWHLPTTGRKLSLTDICGIESLAWLLADAWFQTPDTKHCLLAAPLTSGFPWYCMCNLGKEEKDKYGVDFPKLCYFSSLSPVGKLVLRVGKKGGCLYGVISESILLKRTLQISTASLSYPLICESWHYKNCSLS